jgi:primosomal protein N' (replication factor Y) (superfamily II helicase)
MKYYLLHVDGNNRALYTYLDKEEIFEVGQWVKVNFAGKEKAAIIVKEDNRVSFEYDVREIISIIEYMYPLPEHLIKLFLWIKSYYLCSFGEILSNGYPSNMKISEVKRCFLKRQFIPMNNMETEFLEYMLKKESVATSTLISKFGKEVIKNFLKKQIIIEKIEISNSKSNKKQRVYSIQSEGIKKERVLSNEQKKVAEDIINSTNKYSLIRGVTGSGKTEVYIEIARNAIENGNGVIFLLPEISLTPQMVERFKGEFEGKIALLHSKLTQREREEEWKKIYIGEKQMVLGVRSAVFAPVKNLKYIIIDEEHETTYKQDSSPRYHTRYVALKRAELENVKVIMGSATPSIESYYYGKEGIYNLYELESRFNNIEMPYMKIVDMRNEQNSQFSSELIWSIHQNLLKKEQSLIFLNRKGYSTYVQCNSCGKAEYCPNCSVSLNYFKNENKFKCSYCGYEKVFDKKCSSCGSNKLHYSGQGTEKIEIQLQNLFKDAKILRVDSETTKERDSYENIYRSFINNEYDILVGTQVISKGFHFPNLTLSGIISADGILNFPDFRAGEKSFQLIVQAAGRSGRGEKKGKVVVQTYNPDHYVIQYGIKNDYKGFYQEEIEIRRELNYPPFGRIINIIISSEEEEGLKESSSNFYNMIKTTDVEIYGPFKAPLYKIQGRFRNQIFIKGKREEVLKLKIEIDKTLKEFNDKKVRITIDIDPVNLM